jgi:hypothetical protein
MSDGISLRERAAAAAVAVKQAELRQLERDRAETQDRRRREMVEELKRCLDVDAPPAAVFFDENLAAYVQISDLRFTFRPQRYLGMEYGYSPSELRLTWQCPACHEQSFTGTVENLARLHEQIHAVDDWASGEKPCPACEHRRKEEQVSAPTFPVTPSKTTENRLVDALREFVEQEVRGLELESMAESDA